MSADPDRPAHVPVLLAEVIAALAPCAGEVVVDGTFGAGGYSRALLAAAEIRVVGLDRDPNAAAAAVALSEQTGNRFTFVETAFGDLEEVVQAHVEGGMVDGVVLDIGVSSMQLDDPARGFSFMADGPLDMRMSGAGESAADVLATRGEEEIADILFQLGEERHSRRIARAIVEARQVAPLATTRQLAALVARVLGRGKGDDKHPATRTFQALRIFVNDELGELNRALVGAERVLRPGGRLAVVTFHSLEDRVVKRFLARRSGRSEGASRHGPPLTSAPPPASFRIINRAPLTPSQPELEVNPRARSAKLRSAMRTSAPAYPPETARELGIPEPAGDRRA